MISAKYRDSVECPHCSSLTTSGDNCIWCGNFVPVVISDDADMHWRYNYDRRKIYCVEAEEYYKENYKNDPNDETLLELQQNGYYADNPEEGLELLIECGYITPR